MILRVACVGCGYFAPFHIEAWLRIVDVEVVALCDYDLEKAQNLALQFGINEVYQSSESMLAEAVFDVIDIITPPSSHLKLCKLFANAGKHIICQKPLAPDREICDEIGKIAESMQGRFMVHENFRFQPWHRKIKELLELGTIGDRVHTLHLRLRTGDGWGPDAYKARQPYFREMERFFMHETGVHYVDVFRFLLGEVKSVTAHHRRLNPDIAGEDCVLVILDMERGVGIIDANRYNEMSQGDPRYTFGEVTVEGNAGTLQLNASSAITFKPLDSPVVEIDYARRDHAFAGDCVYFTQSHFVEALRSETPFEVEVPDYLKTLDIVEKVYLSAEKKETINI